MDALLFVTFAGLVSMAIAGYAAFMWYFRDLVRAYMQRKAILRHVSLKDIVFIVLIFPVILTGSVEAVWIYYKGWEDFTRTVSICIEFGFIGGVLLASMMVIFNQIGQHLAKRNQNNQQLTPTPKSA